MSNPIRTDVTKEILAELREAVIFEKQERMDAPAEARRIAEERINAATAKKLALIKAAFDIGATKVAIAQQLGIKNIGQVATLIRRAEGVDE